MLFGSRKEFTYFLCSACHCLQIAEIPKDMSPYYPDEYYSFEPNIERYFRNPISNMIRRWRDQYIVFKKGLIGSWLNEKFKNPDLALKTKALNLTTESRVLDVGCGAGFHLYQLRNIGLRHLLGIDPFIRQDIRYSNGLEIKKQELFQVKASWDVIMFQDSFEHMSDPRQIMQQVAERLFEKGRCLMSLPLSSSFAWKTYGADWVQLDAPRHFFLHSKKSLEILGNQAGMKIIDFFYNSTAFQFWGSEQYRQDIALISEKSYAKNPEKSLFTSQMISAYQKKAAKLNDEGEGDNVIVVFEKK